MSSKGDPATAVTRNLHAAIERVREDVAKVEFWADAVTGFTQPVPEYDSANVKVWFPTEQAKHLGNGTTGNPDDGASAPDERSGADKATVAGNRSKSEKET